MKKDVHFAALFPWNLALITHNAPSSVNPSIKAMSTKINTTFVIKVKQPQQSLEFVPRGQFQARGGENVARAKYVSVVVSGAVGSS